MVKYSATTLGTPEEPQKSSCICGWDLREEGLVGGGQWSCVSQLGPQPPTYLGR